VKETTNQPFSLPVFFVPGKGELTKEPRNWGGAGNAKKGVFGARDDHRDGQVLNIFTVEED